MYDRKQILFPHLRDNDFVLLGFDMEWCDRDICEDIDCPTCNQATIEQYLGYIRDGLFHYRED